MIAHRAINDEADLAQLGDRPSIFLSASVPKPREPLNGVQDPALQQDVAFGRDVRPREIRGAVAALLRGVAHTLAPGYRLVFGAHPAISPMLLYAGRQLGLSKGSLLIFQSRFFEAYLPGSTIELANWDAGEIILTPVRKGSQSSSDPKLQAWYDRQASLTHMRRLMVAVEGMAAAIFIGGMSGVIEEAELFTKRHPDLPQFALGSTGAAAAELLQNHSGYDGGLPPALLAQEPAYSVVMKRILERL